MTSHAAVVARGMGKACVSAAAGIDIDSGKKRLRAGSHEINAGEMITIDGGVGEVMLGAVPTVDPVMSEDFATLMGWADEKRTLRVRAHSACAPTRKRPKTHAPPGNSARKASVFPAPSTCSSTTTASSPCAK